MQSGGLSIPRIDVICENFNMTISNAHMDANPCEAAGIGALMRSDNPNGCR